MRAKPQRTAAPTQLPGNLDQAIFRLGAIAFCSLSTLALIAAYIGPGSQINYAGVWTITGLAYVGGVMSWYLAQRRAPIQLVLVLALLGVLLITLEARVTGGTRTHLLVLYVVPVIFTAALLSFRITALVIAIAVSAAALPLINGWDVVYSRTVLMLAGVMALSAYVETRLLGTAVQEKAAADHRAIYDELTGLPNRALFYRRVREKIQDADGARFAVMLMDLDHFKDINDTLGHHQGDLVLKEVSRRLRKTVDASDTVARLGGDEFGILLPTLRGTGRQVAEHVLDELTPAVPLGGVNIELQASMGVALFPEHGQDVDSLVQKADVAMYQAKAAAGSDVKIYTPQRDPHSTERLELTADLRRALKEGELVVHYQPEIDLQTRQVRAVEALVRWRHPKYGLLPPDKFLSIAERSGLMKPLTREVLAMALRQSRTWRDAGTDLSVAVNVAAPDLLDVQFPDTVEGVLRDRGVPASRLELEITEGTILADPTRAANVLTRLHAMGVRLSVDDFGTGYSSLTYLKDLPVDAVKIDRSFVCDMTSSIDDEVIVRAIIDLARNLGLEVTAEGVEDEATWNRLVFLGCDRAQGHYLSPALPEKEFSLWLRHWAELTETNVATRSRLKVVA
ncbi:MAG TPA: EAL domain-containing protein [Candidatus Acidoferrum sp.]|nr:EAL domain-containing protein [Candidatus Acidoferrum sp.]